MIQRLLLTVRSSAFRVVSRHGGNLDRFRETATPGQIQLYNINISLEDKTPESTSTAFLLSRGKRNYSWFVRVNTHALLPFGWRRA